MILKNTWTSSCIFKIWELISTALSPFLKYYLKKRCEKGKELKEHLPERMGYASLPKPKNTVIYFHAASVGELISILPVITAIHHMVPTQELLVTTGTVTSFHILQDHLKNNTSLAQHLKHQFIPLDVPIWVNRFLTYWNPSLIVLVESELWPNLILNASKRHIPLALINARLSDRSFQIWQRFSTVAYDILSKFDWIAARSEHDQSNFSKLGMNVAYWGDLKQTAPILLTNETELSALQQRFKDKPIWLAASTHPAEEKFILQVHQQLRKKWPDLITIIVPRHPERQHEIIEQLGPIPQRSLNQLPSSDGLWLCDTLGELGLFYRLTSIVFIGNSLEITPKGGGHNPFEPARLSCVIATGPKIHNFKQAYALLEPCITMTPTVTTLVEWVDMMLRYPDKREKQAEQALEIITQNTELTQNIAQHLLTLPTARL